MEFIDYYTILGINRTAKAPEIKKAYRQMALKFHPDKNTENPNAHEQFIKIQEAYEVLKDPLKKLKYDQLYDSRQKFGQSSYQDTYNYKKTTYSNTDQEDLYHTDNDEEEGFFSNFFKQFFSKKKSKSNYENYYKGKDYKGKIAIDLEEAFLGSNRVVTILGEKLRIKIKPGIKNNQQIKIKGKGGYGQLGAERGDLILTITVNPHQIFKRKEYDLYRDISVNIYTAILGGKVQFETLHGTVIIGIPEGTKEGTKLRVKGKGMPKYSVPGEYGDLYVSIIHKMPVALTEEEKSLLNRLKEISKKSTS